MNEGRQYMYTSVQNGNAGKRWLLCEHAGNIWGTRNLQTFVVDIFNHFYITPVERLSNHFIALDMAEDLVTGCAKSVMRTVADKSRWIFETGREFCLSY